MRHALDAETYRTLYGNFADQNPMWNAIPTTHGFDLSMGRELDLHPGAAVL